MTTDAHRLLARIERLQARISWKKVRDGYELPSEKASLIKRGKTWILSTPNGEVDLGKKASFDKAESHIQEMKKKR